MPPIFWLLVLLPAFHSASLKFPILPMVFSSSSLSILAKVLEIFSSLLLPPALRLLSPILLLRQAFSFSSASVLAKASAIFSFYAAKSSPLATDSAIRPQQSRRALCESALFFLRRFVAREGRKSR